MKEIFLLVAVALSVSLLASLVFYFKWRGDDFAERNETLLIYLWECREKANAWDKLLEMADIMEIYHKDEAIYIQHNSNYDSDWAWILTTNRSDQTIVGRTPVEAFMKYLRRGRP